MEPSHGVKRGQGPVARGREEKSNMKKQIAKIQSKMQK
jgi:hypothetical protein